MSPNTSTLTNILDISTSTASENYYTTSTTYAPGDRACASNEQTIVLLLYSENKPLPVHLTKP